MAMNSSNSTDESPTFSVVSLEIACTIAFSIFIAGLTGNGLICYGYFRYRRLRTLTNFFVMNLAVADLVLISVLVSWIIQDLRGNPNRMIVGKLLPNMEILCFSASMLNMASVSVDRYFAVRRPLRYPNIVTRPRARKTVLLIWLYSILVAGVGVARSFTTVIDNKIYITTLASISFLLPTIVIIFAHLNIFKIAWLAKKESCDNQSEVNTKNKLIAPRIKLSINTLIILFPMAIAWGVFYGITIIEAHRGKPFELSPVLHFVVGLLPFIAAAIDPIVYLILTRDLRSVVHSMCTCYHKKRRESEHINLPTLYRKGLHERRESPISLLFLQNITQDKGQNSGRG